MNMFQVPNFNAVRIFIGHFILMQTYLFVYESFLFGNNYIHTFTIF